jgi:hypothetical protein
MTMSITPVTPNLKSFWDRPEGKTGMVFLVAGGIAASVGLYFLLPFLITLVANTLYLGGIGDRTLRGWLCGLQRDFPDPGEVRLQEYHALDHRDLHRDRSYRHLA